MTPGLRLNTAHAHTWAAVVSGTAWKRHALEDGGTLTAEYTRGPVIVWATKISWRKSILDSFHLTHSWNGIFKNLLRSLDSKYNRDNEFFIKSLEQITLSHINYSAVFACTFGVFFKASAGNTRISEYGKYVSATLRHLAEKLKRYADVQEEIRGKKPNLYARFWHWSQLQAINVRGLASYKERLALVRILYRAHLTRRVRPAPRRHRIRRPLYARPRPPSAPLAPPVI